MIIFRPYNEILALSLAEAKEFNSVDEMKKYVVELVNSNRKDPEILSTVNDIVIGEVELDEWSTGWEDTRKVSLKIGFGASTCIGFVATKYKK